MQNNIGELLSLMEVVDAAAFGGEERRAELLARLRAKRQLHKVTAGAPT